MAWWLSRRSCVRVVLLILGFVRVHGIRVRTHPCAVLRAWCCRPRSVGLIVVLSGGLRCTTRRRSGARPATPVPCSLTQVRVCPSDWYSVCASLFGCSGPLWPLVACLLQYSVNLVCALRFRSRGFFRDASHGRTGLSLSISRFSRSRVVALFIALI